MRVMWTFSAFFIGLISLACDSPRSELTPLAQSPALLFDDGPGYPMADELLYRSDWPSTESSHQLGEFIFYQERFIDIQSTWPYGRSANDRTYRRFSTWRSGVGVR